MSEKKIVRLIDVPMDLGSGRRGVDVGPSAMRLAGIRKELENLGIEVQDDQENIFIPDPERCDIFDEKLKFLPAIVRACTQLARCVDQAKTEGVLPLVMGGDHSMAVGTIAGVSAWAKRENHRLGVFWIDAHADFNTRETSPTGNIHGMPLAASAGIGVSQLTELYGPGPKVMPENIVILGLRSVDNLERLNLRNQGIKVFTMQDIDKHGMFDIMEMALDSLKRSCDLIHVSFDVDSMDPETAPGVGTPIKGGLNYREVHLIMETLAESGLVGSLEIAEVNPILDIRNQTAETAVSMAASCLGKTIL